jgi:hypothetical protein
MQCTCHPQLLTSLLLGPPTLARNDETQLPRRNDCVDCRAFLRFRCGAIQSGELLRGPKRLTGCGAGLQSLWLRANRSHIRFFKIRWQLTYKSFGFF